jgi:hypothetical protein
MSDQTQTQPDAYEEEKEGLSADFNLDSLDGLLEGDKK